jgi:outer membrane protein assembly factor BamB
MERIENPTQQRPLAFDRVGTERQRSLQALRRTIVTCLWFVTLICEPASAVPQNEPSRRDLLVSYQRAVELLKSDEPRRGITAMQAIVVALDLKDDIFLGAVDGSQRSLKLECFNQLRSLSDPDFQFYENQFGPEATAQLRAARTNNDLEALDSVSRRYFYTTAGTDASRELALRKLDKGDALGAALDLSRLKSLARDPESLEPALSAILATAWAQAGVPDEARRVLNRVAESENRTLRTSDSDVLITGTEWADWLPTSGRNAAVDGWAMPLGNMQRVRSTGRVVPKWQPQWRANILETLVIETPSDRAAAEAGFDYMAQSAAVQRRERERLRLPAVPASVPLVVGDRVIFRSPLTVKAVRAIADEDYEAGELEWETYKPDPFIMSAFRGHADQRNLSAIDVMSRAYMYADRTSGSMTSDGKFVFVVEETDRLLSQRMLRQRRDPDTQIADPNFLRAYELSSGSVAWQIGGEGGIRVAGMRDAVFLGPPMPFGEDLLLIAASRDELRLLQLQVRNPSSARPDIRLVWSQQISRVTAERGLSGTGRLSGLSPAFMGGVLVCPTGYGDLVALDPASRTLLWRFAPDQSPGRFGRGWNDATPRIVDGLVLWSPLNSSEIYCVDLQSGQKKWSTAFSNGAWTAVTDRFVVCVGGDQVMAYLTSTGKPAWREPVRIEQPTGRGLVHGETISIPIAGRTVRTLDLATGNQLAETLSPVPLGNLVAVGDRIVSQSATTIVSFDGFNTIQKQIAESLQKQPDNADTLLTQAIMYLQTGELDLGLKSMKSAADLNTNPLAARLLVRTVTSLSGDQLRDNIGLLADIEEPKPPVALPTLHGLTGPVQSVAALVSPLQDSATLKIQLARFDAPGELTLDSASELLKPLFQLATEVRHDRVVVEKDRVVSEARYLAAEVRRLLSSTTKSNRNVVGQAIEKEVSSFISDERFDEAKRMLLWFEQPGNRIRERLAVALLESEPGYAIPLLESIRESSTADLRLRVTRRLIEQLTPVRPNHARVIATELRFESATNEAAADLLKKLEEDPKLTQTVSATRAWPVVDIVIKKGGNFPLDDRQGIQVQGEPADNLLVYREGESLIGFDRWHRPTFEYLYFTDGNVPSVRDEFYVLETATSLVVSGNEVTVLDLLGDSKQARLLWQEKLKPASSNSRRSFFERNHRPVGPVAGQTLLVRSGSNIIAKDLRSGSTLWTRNIDAATATLHADESKLAIVAQSSVELYSMLDGRWLGSRRRSLQPAQVVADVGRGQVLGRLVRIDGNTRVELVQMNFGELEPAWRHEFDSNTTLSNASAGFCATVDGDRAIHIFRLKDGQRVASVVGDDTPDIDTAVLHSTADEFIVIGRTRRQAFGGQQALTGFMVAIDRLSGRKLWEQEFNSEFPFTDADFEVPFRGRMRREQILGANLPVFVLADGSKRGGFSYRIIDCRTGETIYKSTDQIGLPEGRFRVLTNDRAIQMQLGQQHSLKLTFPGE